MHIVTTSTIYDTTIVKSISVMNFNGINEHLNLDFVRIRFDVRVSFSQVIQLQLFNYQTEIINTYSRKLEIFKHYTQIMKDTLSGK